MLGRRDGTLFEKSLAKTLNKGAALLVGCSRHGTAFVMGSGERSLTVWQLLASSHLHSKWGAILPARDRSFLIAGYSFLTLTEVTIPYDIQHTLQVGLELFRSPYI